MAQVSTDGARILKVFSMVKILVVSEKTESPMGSYESTVVPSKLFQCLTIKSEMFSARNDKSRIRIFGWSIKLLG